MKKQNKLWFLLILVLLVALVGFWAASRQQPSAVEDSQTILVDDSGPKTEPVTQDPAAAPAAEETQTQKPDFGETGSAPEESAYYYSPDDVALYLHVYGHLPGNYITKDEAYDLGWDSREGNLWDVAEGMCIGGDRFGNYEGQLPRQRGRTYYECDVNYSGGYRGGERIIYSSDGLIFYTADHYATFEQLY